MDRVESDLAQLTGFVKTIAVGAGKHDEQIQALRESTRALIERSGQHDDQIQAIVGATKVLLRKSGYWEEQIEKQSERANRFDEQFDRLYQLSEKNEEHLGILMGIMDEWIRSQGREKE